MLAVSPSRVSSRFLLFFLSLSLFLSLVKTSIAKPGFCRRNGARVAKFYARGTLPLFYTLGDFLLSLREKGHARFDQLSPEVKRRHPALSALIDSGAFLLLVTIGGHPAVLLVNYYKPDEKDILDEQIAAIGNERVLFINGFSPDDLLYYYVEDLNEQYWARNPRVDYLNFHEIYKDKSSGKHSLYWLKKELYQLDQEGKAPKFTIVYGHGNSGAMDLGGKIFNQRHFEKDYFSDTRMAPGAKIICISCKFASTTAFEKAEDRILLGDGNGPASMKALGEALSSEKATVVGSTRDIVTYPPVRVYERYLSDQGKELDILKLFAGVGIYNWNNFLSSPEAFIHSLSEGLPPSNSIIEIQTRENE